MQQYLLLLVDFEATHPLQMSYANGPLPSHCPTGSKIADAFSKQVVLIPPPYPHIGFPTHIVPSPTYCFPLLHRLLVKL